MTVDKLFWDGPYLTRCDATVAVVAVADVTVDRTVAFAFSGGQASDAGSIGEHEILSARTEGLEIVYTLPAGHGLTAGDPVVIAIDGTARSRIMRLHFAAELVLELVTQLFGRTQLLGSPEKIGANITAEKARVDFAWDGDIREALPAVKAELARLVEADLPISSDFSDRSAQRRFWRIDGFAEVACGGTHPRSTGEVGRVALKRANPGAGKERIEITLRSPSQVS